jgi:NAD+ kinase
MRTGVFGGECKPDKLAVICGLFSKLRSYGAEVYVEASFAERLRLAGVETYSAGTISSDSDGRISSGSPSIDIALSVGGDGTFLRTAVRVQSFGTPTLGVNTGRLGFLADVGSNEIEAAIDELFRGEYYIEERTLLELEVCGGVNDVGDGAASAIGGFPLALNEVAVLKHDTSSMLTIHASLDDEYLTSYKADGLVVATPTGSTAYSISVGGPILLPINRNFVLSPVAPHSLNIRPIVIPDTCKIMLKAESRTNSFLVSLDGRTKDFDTDTELIIRRSTKGVRVIKRFNHTFYRTLREKLMWGVDVRS